MSMLRMLLLQKCCVEPSSSSSSSSSSVTPSSVSGDSGSVVSVSNVDGCNCGVIPVRIKVTVTRAAGGDWPCDVSCGEILSQGVYVLTPDVNSGYLYVNPDPNGGDNTCTGELDCVFDGGSFRLNCPPAEGLGAGTGYEITVFSAQLHSCVESTIFPGVFVSRGGSVGITSLTITCDDLFNGVSTTYTTGAQECCAAGDVTVHFKAAA